MKENPDNPQPSQREPSLLSTMRKTIARYRMFEAGDHVVVAVSGGADSIALLHALYAIQDELELRLTVAHLNHGLRGEAAEREADFVQKIAHTLNLPCICELRDVRADKHASGECLQEAARTARYSFFTEVLSRCHAQKLALGHTMDDQAETVLIRLLRGASTRGLSGIPPVRSDTVVRPLIHVRRSTIEHFLQERGIPFVPDTSADEPQYLRNKIRHELLPLLTRQYNPRAVEALCTTADLARDDEALLQETAVRVLNEALQPGDGSVRIPIDLLEGHPLLAGRIIRRARELLCGSCRGLASVHVDAVLSLCGYRGSNKKISIPGGIVVRREYNELVMGPACSPVPFHIPVDQLPADILVPQNNTLVKIQKIAHKEIDTLQRTAASDTVHLAADSIRLPIIIRSWKPGDRIQPFGCTTEKKVKVVFAEAKIPVRLRACIPLIESNGRIVSVGTLRMAEHCRVTPACREVIAVTITASNTR